MTTKHRRQRLSVRDDKEVDAGDQKAADRAERLGIAEDTFPLLRIGKQLGQPRDGGDKLHTDADERGAAKDQ